MKPFKGWYEASAWCTSNALGPCMVLTPGKVWQWFGKGSEGVVYICPFSQRRLCK